MGVDDLQVSLLRQLRRVLRGDNVSLARRVSFRFQRCFEAFYIGWVHMKAATLKKYLFSPMNSRGMNQLWASGSEPKAPLSLMSV